MGMLDLSSLGGSAPFAGLLNMGDTDPLNSVPGYGMRAETDPFKEADKKKALEDAAIAARSVFDQGGSPVPQAGISGQQAMTPGAYGSLAPVLAQATPPALPTPVANAQAQAPSIPMPQPRPAMAPPAEAATLPQGATPTEGTLPMTKSLANADAPESSLIGRLGQKVSDNSNLLLGLASGFAGAGSLGTGMSRGFANAIPGSQLDQKYQTQNATINFLKNKGLPDDIAKAAATNPAVLQQILPQVLGAKQRKFTQIGEDMMGNKKFGFVDETSSKAYGMDGQPIEHGNGASSIVPTGSDGQPLSGKPLLDHLEKVDPVTAAGIKGLISGDLNAQGRNLQKLAPLAKLVDPTFDATQYPVRLKTRESYTSGKDFQETQALNTVAGHLGELKESAGKLGNTTVPLFNKAQNWFADNFTGSPSLVKFRNDLVTTSNELAKAYHGGHVSDSAYAAFNKAVNEAQTPAEMKAAIGELGGLLQSKIEAKESGYRSSMADAPLPSEYKAINEKAKKSFQDINDWANGTAKADAGAKSTAAPVKVTSPADAAKLPKGTHFMDPNGVERVVP